MPATAVLWSSFMARMVNCIKLDRESEGPPYPGELGKRTFDNISREAWKAVGRAPEDASE